MKKILLVLVLFTVSYSIKAQTLMTGSADTVTNTATKTNYLQLKESFGTVTIQTTVTKISGTVAGTITLKGSLDGTNYATIDTLACVTNKNTFATTNVASQSTAFIVDHSPYLYYMVSYTGSGTMSASISSYILGRK